MEKEKKVAIVTGGSGGIGRCTAAALSRAGCRVYELSRRERPAEGVIHLTADVTDEEQTRAAVEQVMEREDLKHCPHGRPICVTLSKKQLEKQFKRI